MIGWLEGMLEDRMAGRKARRQDDWKEKKAGSMKGNYEGVMFERKLRRHDG